MTRIIGSITLGGAVFGVGVFLSVLWAMVVAFGALQGTFATTGLYIILAGSVVLGGLVTYRFSHSLFAAMILVLLCLVFVVITAF